MQTAPNGTAIPEANGRMNLFRAALCIDDLFCLGIHNTAHCAWQEPPCAAAEINVQFQQSPNHPLRCGRRLDAWETKRL